MRHPIPSKMNPLGGNKVAVWRSSADEELSKLIVTEERAKWIQRRYPESDQGRPGILHTDSRDRGSKRVRETDDDPADIEVGLPAWGTSQEFEGDEGEQEQTEIAIGVAAH